MIKGLILAGRSKDEIASLFNECPRRSQDSRRVREGERQEKGGSKGKGTQEKRATEDSTIKNLPVEERREVQRLATKYSWKLKG